MTTHLLTDTNSPPVPEQSPTTEHCSLQTLLWKGEASAEATTRKSWRWMLLKDLRVFYSILSRGDGGEILGKQAVISSQKIFRKVSD